MTDFLTIRQEDYSSLVTIEENQPGCYIKTWELYEDKDGMKPWTNDQLVKVKEIVENSSGEDEEETFLKVSLD